MIQSSILPKYNKVIYTFNPGTRYFIQSEIQSLQTHINRLPLELRTAPAGANNVKSNASKLLLSKEGNKGKYGFITGIQETSFAGRYIGNDFEYYRGQKHLSIILFRFMDNETTIEVYYFRKYDKPNSFYRLQFANSIIPLLSRNIAA